MMRRVAVVGDVLLSGGTVLDYPQPNGFTFHGHKAALVGNAAFCSTCKTKGVIAMSGGTRRLGFGSTRDTALDGDVVLCGCKSHPRIVALLAGESWVEDADTGITRDSTAYDEQIKATHSTVDLAGYPYVIETADGRTYSGHVQADGTLPRISTDSESDYSIVWGDQALAHEGWG